MIVLLDKWGTSINERIPKTLTDSAKITFGMLIHINFCCTQMSIEREIGFDRYEREFSRY